MISVVDGGWSKWKYASKCHSSKTCGRGEKLQVRSCSEPYPLCGGKRCIGRKRKFKTCYISAGL